MSNRRNAFAGSATNPAEKFLTWKSNEQCFEYYNKETKTKEPVKLPFKFVVLDQLHTVKGWSDALGGGIIANEVKFIGKDTLTVNCYHKKPNGEQTKTKIAEGIYKNIKDGVVSAGGKYHASIYIMLEDGTIANLQLKGASVQAWSNFTQKNKNRLPDEWVIVKGAVKGKKGAVTFHTPEFTFERSLSTDEVILADTAFDKLEDYLTSYLVKGIHVQEAEVLQPQTNEEFPEDEDPF